MEETNDDNFLYSPYIAAIADKDEAGQQQFFERFSRLEQPVKDFLTSPQIATKLGGLVDSGMIPDEYALAVAKIIAFAAMGDVAVPSIGSLLMKIGLTEPQSQTIAAEIERILQPLAAERAKTVVPQKMPEMPPMSRATETGPRAVPSSGTPARNIIDLRNKS